VIVAGLTGSIAMGKSTVARMFVQLGCPVFDADSAVRDFYQAEGAGLVESIFPGVVVDGVVDRERLATRVLSDGDAMSRLETVVHPAVALRRARFLEHARELGRRAAFFDIPLLFETGAESAFDLVVVVSARPEVQRARGLARAGATRAKFEAIVSRQMPDIEKRRRAHFVIDTNGPLDESCAQAESLVRAIGALSGAGLRNA
jgi:dephospho-CoA kinase